MLHNLHLHPRALNRLFFTEMWERFSFYGLNAILVLFMTKVMHIPDGDALIVFGSYVTYIYLSTTLGGILADRLFGYYRVVFMGGLFILCGHLLLAASAYSMSLFYLGLGSIATGTGLLKPNVSVMVGKLYTHDQETMRVQGFNIFYMGINIGGFLAPILVGFAAEKVDWHFGFGLAAIGMALGLFIFYRGHKLYPVNTTYAYVDKLRHKFFGISTASLVYALLVLITVLFALLIANPVQSVAVISGCAIGLIIYIGILWRKLNTNERKNVFLILVLSFFSVSYWSLSNQTISTLPLFIDRVVDRNVLGFNIPSSSIFGMYAFLLIVCAPVVAFLWYSLNKIHKEPNYAGKFALGLLCATLAFVFIILGINQALATGHMGLIWVVICYLLLVLGELFISPNGLALVTSYAPNHLSGIMMGLWWMINAFAGFIAALIGQLIGLSAKPGQSLQAELLTYRHGFIQIVIIAGVITLLLFIIRNKLSNKKA